MDTRIYDNDLFLRTIHGHDVERPPIWLMRQAGRILPQYRKVRASLSGFIELVQTPEKVAEVTIQPVDELDVDAAIIFSDILVIPECMGLPYEMVEKRGPLFPKTIETLEDVEALSFGEEAISRLQYVYDGLHLTKEALENRVPLIGFSGAPWTLFCYMIEGQGSKTFSKAKSILYRDPELAHSLLDKLTSTIIPYLKKKHECGTDVVQIFDSWAGVLDRELYREFIIPYLLRIKTAMSAMEIPTIVFSKGAWFSLDDIAALNSAVIGIDWNMSPEYVRDIVGDSRVVQGNLDPCVLYGSHEKIVRRTEDMIRAFGGNHIVNLGHGVYPDTPLDGVKTFVNTVKAFRY